MYLTISWFLPYKVTSAIVSNPTVINSFADQHSFFIYCAVDSICSPDVGCLLRAWISAHFEDGVTDRASIFTEEIPSVIARRFLIRTHRAVLLRFLHCSFPTPLFSPSNKSTLASHLCIEGLMSSSCLP